jgi:hypothetical protein
MQPTPLWTLRLPLRMLLLPLPALPAVPLLLLRTLLPVLLRLLRTLLLLLRKPLTDSCFRFWRKKIRAREATASAPFSLSGTDNEPPSTEGACSPPPSPSFHRWGFAQGRSLAKLRKLAISRR